MNPAFSVLVFTVAAGAGYGLLSWLALLLLLPTLSQGAAPLGSGELLTGGLLGLVLVTLGLLSSTLHLGNPKNAWRSFMRFRSSWLSREAVCAVLFYPLALLWLAAALGWLPLGGGAVAALSLLTLLLAQLIVFTTGMIYACLKTIRHWHTPLTPVNYLMIGLCTGLLLLLAVRGLVGDAGIGRLGEIAPMLLAAGAIAKWLYFRHARLPGKSLNDATGLGDGARSASTAGRVRLLDQGHTAGTFLTDEFDYRVTLARIAGLRLLVAALLFAVPILLLSSASTGDGGGGTLLLAALAGLAGALVERWLFFAEARHVVNLYHGRPA